MTPTVVYSKGACWCYLGKRAYGLHLPVPRGIGNLHKTQHVALMKILTSMGFFSKKMGGGIAEAGKPQK